MSREAYAGARRKKQTPWRVKYGDALVTRLITVGGMGTIAAVMLVVLVLLASAWPLHRSPEFSSWHSFDVTVDDAKVDSDNGSKAATTSGSHRHFGLDEYGVIYWCVKADGEVIAYAAHSGEEVGRFPGPTSPESTDSRSVSCSTLSTNRQHLVLGFTDGTYQVTTLSFRSLLVSRAEVPSDIKLNESSPRAVSSGSIYELFDGESVRQVEMLAPVWTVPAKLAEESLLALDYVPPNTSNQFSQQSSSLLVAATATEIIAADIVGQENILTGEITQEVTLRRGALQSRSKRPPLELMIANRSTQVIVAWDIGTLDRFSLEGEQPRLVESVSGSPDGGTFTSAANLIGRQTLLLGDDRGRLHGWMIVQDESGTEGGDDYRLVAAHHVKLGKSAIRSISSSSANHLALATSEANELSLVMVTTDSLLKRVSLPTTGKLVGAALSSKNDRVVAVSDSQVSIAQVDTAFPEATWRGLFGYVWYEGYAEPQAIWQSSAGTELSEPKLSLLPLVFGTLKATVYAMIFSVPLAILAAIYTSEFLSPRVRSRVKPLIEMMASLPSVVLGFIAALVLAPLLQEHLCAVLLSLMLVPLTFVFAAHLWNVLPLDLLVRLQGWRLSFLAVCVPVGLLVASSLAKPVEHWLFAGDVTQWLSGSIGTGVGGWMLLLIPAVAVAAVAVLLGPLAESDRRRAVAMTPFRFALRGLVRLVIVSAVVILVAWVASFALDRVGLDLRDSLFAGYQERNSLLVGAVLGFCVIPLIYTLADDALQSVPQQLRSASLGCGATPWQTTVRVVVPSAMSGIFSAIMIGLGRAVGETMVVLMAAGNTPIMEWNPFNGFRTLSATLATELPEAAKGSTHYRTLFLAALLLFMLTLIANTVAEFVRIRFRKRSSQL